MINLLVSLENLKLKFNNILTILVLEINGKLNMIILRENIVAYLNKSNIIK